jgi:hypothetical protein
VRLDNARRRITRERSRRQSLRRKAAEPVEVDQAGELQPIAERPRRPHHRIVEAYAGNLYGQAWIVLSYTWRFSHSDE